MKKSVGLVYKHKDPLKVVQFHLEKILDHKNLSRAQLHTRGLKQWVDNQILANERVVAAPATQGISYKQLFEIIDFLKKEV